MIQITPHMRILLCVEPVDFRKGIDGLVGICKRKLKSDPFSGALFVFRNRGGKAIKVLVYDGQGFWLCQKRLSSGRFKWWPGHVTDAVSRLEAHQLQMLLFNGDPSGVQVPPPWKKIALR